MKSAVKELMFTIFLVLASPVSILYLIGSVLISKDRLFSGYSQLMSLFPGMIGNYLRVGFYRVAMTRCDKEVVISFGTIFSQTDTEILEGTYIGPQCNIGKSRIEANCLLGSGVHIMSGKGQHNFSDLDTPLREQGGEFSKVTIGEDSWIGNGALIMANVGKKCIIGAGSVVISDIPDYAIVAGNPAKIIKMRN
ncbi:acetyltransferase [Hahella sp. CCB-MM4]|uniref:acyltransferase n=1 Tax=Hahella sp. (strain CCB-MM4) TaxID=1926491 RepID=UPI000B9A69F6|nr:acyltransferase [Hahella sp. CCB-MM4]OZG73420.1 acetyltransferase [Hahella sp. CCB-MM4]